MAHDVFISYANDDRPAADAIVARLEREGVRCWFGPRDILPGEDRGHATAGGVAGARVAVVVVSARANASQQVAREVERAARQGLAIVALRIEDVQPGRGLDLYPGAQHWLDAFAPPLTAHLDRLAQTIAVLLERPAASLAKGGGEPAMRVSGTTAAVVAALIMAVAGVVVYFTMRGDDSGMGDRPAPKESTSAGAPWTATRAALGGGVP